MMAYTFYEFDTRVMLYAEALAKRGDSVDIIALRRPDQCNFEVVRDVNVYRIQERIRNEKGKLNFIFRILKFFVLSMVFITRKHLKERYDVIHVHSVPDFQVFSALIPKLMGAKIILDIHDIVPEFYASKFNTAHDSLLFKTLVLIEKASIAFSNHVIIANHIWKDRLISRSVKKEKCTVILNYPDPTFFYPRPHVNSNSKLTMIYPGTLNWHQGLDIAIKAFSKIKDEASHVEFHIYGEGDEKSYLEELVQLLDLENQVFLKGHLPVDQIAEIIASADIGIVPKRAVTFGNEAFSTKIYEFMAVGIPTIVSRTMIDEYYFNDDLVCFFNSDDKEDLGKSMLRLINNPDIRKKLSSNASEYIKSNNWSAKSNIYLNLVDSL